MLYTCISLTLNCRSTHAIDHTLRINVVVGLICWAMHADPSVYNNCFLLSQINTLKIASSIVSRPTCVHSLFINIPFFSPKQNAVLSKTLTQRKISKASEGKTIIKYSKKSNLRESYDAHSKRTCSTNFLQAPQLRHSCYKPPLFMPAQLLKQSIGT